MMRGEPGSMFTLSALRFSNKVFQRYTFIFIKSDFPKRERGCDGSSERGQGDGERLENTSSGRALLPLGFERKGMP